MNYEINIKDRSRVVVGDVGVELERLLPAKRVVVVSDTNLDRYYPSLIGRYDHILIGQGETSKTLLTLDTIYRRLIELGVDRSTFILAIGGGIVTDVAGFAASTYMRGVEFGFVTTSLLGAVDASVGGKNGINVGGFKNMVGTFSQPQFVVCDASLLATLSVREFRAGVAEIIKTAILGDAELFEILENNTFDTLRNDNELLEDIITRCVRVKAEVVAEDEREGGRRRILNLGHTIAHAIEKSSNKMNHGEAVAVGLHHITHSALAQKVISEGDAKRIFALIEQYGFDIELPVERKQLLKAIEGDKKRRGDALHVILPTAIGAVEDRVVTFEELHELLQ